MSQRKLRDLPNPLTLPKLLGSAGDWKPPGVSHELKGVQMSHEAVRRETTGPSAFPVLSRVSRRRMAITSFPFSSGPFSSLQLLCWCWG